MVLSVRAYPPLRVLAAVLCAAVLIWSGLAAVTQAQADIRSLVSGSEVLDDQLLAKRTDKTTYWVGVGCLVLAAVMVTAVAVAVAPPVVLVTVGSFAITAKTATVASGALTVVGIGLQGWGGRPQ